MMSEAIETQYVPDARRMLSDFGHQVVLGLAEGLVEGAASSASETDEEYGSSSSTVRVLAAAVLRLADENLALAAEVDRLRRVAGPVGPLEAIEVAVGEWGEVTGDGTGTPLPPIERDGRAFAGLGRLVTPDAWGSVEAFERFRAEATAAAEAHRADTAADYHPTGEAE